MVPGSRHQDGGLREACNSAGIIYGRFKKGGFIYHDFRHTFNTNMRKAGVPESVIMKITGHSSRAMFDRYNTVDEGDPRQAIESDEGRGPKPRAEAFGHCLVTKRPNVSTFFRLFTWPYSPRQIKVNPLITHIIYKFLHFYHLTYLERSGFMSWRVVDKIRPGSSPGFGTIQKNRGLTRSWVSPLFSDTRNHKNFSSERNVQEIIKQSPIYRSSLKIGRW